MRPKRRVKRHANFIKFATNEKNANFLLDDKIFAASILLFSDVMTNDNV